MVIDHSLTPPTRVAANQVRLAVLVAVKERGNIGVLQVFQIGNIVLFGCRLIYEVALECAHLHFIAY